MKVVKFALGFLAGFVLASIIGCSDATGPSDVTYRPQFEQVYQGGGSGGHGGGGGGGAASICTLAGTSNSVECSKLLLRLATGGLAGGAACLRGQWAACGALFGWGTEAAMDWRNHPDPWYQPWFNPGVPGSQGLWPPGVGGTYPMPIGGY